MPKKITCQFAYIGRVALANIVVGLCTQTISHAQIVPDSTLPTNSVMTQTDSTYVITAGSISGSNLFHSFEEFSVPDSSTALFDNALTVDRIITRVTGGNSSAIEGLLRANGGADFFLINPDGVTFGPNAQLDLAGSFIVSTANQLDFADGTIFSAVNPSLSPVLTISTPVGLQYGSSSGAITVLGPGNGMGFDADNFVLDRSQRPDGLRVQDGETLALVGSGINLQGGNVTASDGRIELGSVAGSQSVGLSELDMGWSLSYDTVSQFHDVRLSDAASVDVSGINGGALNMQGDVLRLTGGSTILSTAGGRGQGGQTVVHARDRLVVTGFSSTADGTPLLPSSVITGLETGATGIGGSIDIETPILRIVNGGAIASNNLGSGTAGNLRVTAPRRVVVDGGIPELEFSGGLLADVYGEGEGGGLSIDTGLLSVTGGGEVSASTFAVGDSGPLVITAETVDVFGGAPILFESQIVTSVQEDASGNADGITITTDSLSVSGGAIITSDTFGSGDGGNINISAQTVDLFGTSPNGLASGLFTGAESIGNGGDLFVDATVIQISEGAEVQTSTTNEGNAGNLQLQAQSIYLVGSETTSTAIAAAVDTIDGISGPGNGGNLMIQAQSLDVSNSAQVVIGTRGSGDAGSMVIEVDNIRLEGANSLRRSGLFASAIIGTGEGGNIQVRGDRLTIEDGAIISASNFPSNDDLSLAGSGAAGNIDIDVRDIRLSDDGRITASTATGGRGNVAIDADAMFLTNLSKITTNSQGQEPGGNIAINADLLVGLGNSDITANAEASRGGRILINSDQIYGLVFREQLTPGNDVTATSELGAEFNGVVQINNPDVEITPGQLPDTVLIEDSPLVVTCDPFPDERLVVMGRGGLPTHPFRLTDGQSLWQDWRLVDQLALSQLPPSQGSRQSNPVSRDAVSDRTRRNHGQHRGEAIAPIQEAEQFRRTPSGGIVLTRHSQEISHLARYYSPCDSTR